MASHKNPQREKSKPRRKGHKEGTARLRFVVSPNGGSLTTKNLSPSSQRKKSKSKNGRKEVIHERKRLFIVGSDTQISLDFNRQKIAQEHQTRIADDMVHYHIQVNKEKECIGKDKHYARLAYLHNKRLRDCAEMSDIHPGAWIPRQGNSRRSEQNTVQFTAKPETWKSMKYLITRFLPDLEELRAAINKEIEGGRHLDERKRAHQKARNSKH